MKKTLVFIALCSAAISGANAASLTPKEGVSIMYINGQEADSRVGVNQIDDGFNQVVLRMDKNMSNGSNADVFTSKPYVLEFEVDGEDVVVNHPIARSKQEAEAAFDLDEPAWRITQGSQVVMYDQELLKGKSGFFPYNGMGELVTKHNAQRGIFFENGNLVDKPVTAEAIAVTTTGSVASTSAVTEAVAVSSNVQQLKAWYLKASKQERKEFRRWMIDQE